MMPQAKAVLALGSAATQDKCSSKNIFEDAWKTCEHSTPLRKLFGQKLKEARDAVVQTAVDSLLAGSLPGARLRVLCLWWSCAGLVQENGEGQIWL